MGSGKARRVRAGHAGSVCCVPRVGATTTDEACCLDDRLPRRDRVASCAGAGRAETHAAASPEATPKMRSYPDWLFPVDPNTACREAATAEAAQRPPKLDDVELLDDPRQRPEIHAGAHQRSVQCARLAARTIIVPMPDIVAQGPQAQGHGLRVLPHAHRTGPARRTRRSPGCPRPI